MSFLSQIVDEINAVRTNPAAYAIKVKKYIPYFQGTILKMPDQRVNIKTYEGAVAYEECANFLKIVKPTEACIPSKGLTKIAKDFLSRARNVDPSQFYTIDMDSIINKYGNFTGNFSRVIDFGGSTPEKVVISLLVNDGDKSRGQRDALLNPKLKNVGVSQGKHEIYGAITVIVFCTKFQEYYVETEEEVEEIKEINQRQFNFIKKDELKFEVRNENLDLIEKIGKLKSLTDEEIKKEKNKVQLLEDMNMMGTIMKEKILKEKKTNPEKFFTTKEIIEQKENNDDLFALGIFSKALESQGMVTAIEKEVNENDDEKKIAQTSLQFLVNGISKNQNIIYVLILEKIKIISY